MKIKDLYRNLGIVISIIFAIACSDDKLTENDQFISVNPNPEDVILSTNEQWDWVGKFPGEVDNSIQRLVDIEVVVNGDYKYNKESLFEPAQKNLQSTGLYVPPAELVEVNLSTAAPGLMYQIGIADIFIPSEGNSYSRYENVVKKGELTQGTNIIASNFGGHLYFYYEDEPVPGEITLTVNNAVKSLDFILGETDVEEWLDDVHDSINTPMIWGEIIGKKVILTLPLEILQEVERPDILIETYDDLVTTDMEALGGFTEETGMHSRINTPVRLYSDVQLPNNPYVTQNQPFGALFKGGYPMAINTSVSQNLENVIINPTKFDNENIKYLMGAFGSTFQPVWNTGDAFAGSAYFLPLYRASHRKREWPIINEKFEEVFDKYRADPTLKFMHLDQNDRVGMLIQLAQEYGWNIYGYISQRIREEVADTVQIDLVKNDLLAIFASEYAEKDLTPFFNDWKFPFTSFAGESMSKFTPPAEKFWSSFTRKFGDVDATLIGTRLQIGDIPQQDSIYDRSEWVGNSSPIQSGTIEEQAKLAIDGNPATIWHSKWENGTASGGMFPHWLSYTFDELTFNYFYLQPRQGGGGHNSPRIFRFEVEDEVTGEWIPVEEGKEFYLRRVNDMQYFYLSKAYTTKSIRMYMITPHTGQDDNRAQFQSVSLAEIGVGLIY